MIQKKWLITLAGLSLVLAACSPAAETSPTSESDEAMMETTTSETTMETSNLETDNTAEEATGIYTLAEVAMHSTETDCWFAIEGKVYDVTEYIASGKHGGGEAIIEGCGKDATELFNTRPMGSGTPHSDKARGFLPNFVIGDLAE